MIGNGGCTLNIPLINHETNEWWPTANLSMSVCFVDITDISVHCAVLQLCIKLFS